ncbi:MAG: AGE family epimerase/isomerase [Bacillota bacterium]
MNKEQLQNHQKWIKEELDKCIQFWIANGLDEKNGGVFTCLDREGKVYSTDKSVWMQGRCAWTFAYLCKVYGKKDEWLAISKSCLDFMEAHCINRDKGNRMYFTVTAEGAPLRQRRYCFSEGFYAIANAEYFGLTGEKIYLERAKEMYELIYKLNKGLIDDPVGLGAKTIATTRSGRALADPMIYLNITSVLRRVDKDDEALYNERAKESVDDILKYHYKPELGYTLESVAVDGSPQMDYTSGRILNPGHAIECAWFLMEQSLYTKEEKLFSDACNVFTLAIEKGWDKEYDGLLYFVDCLGLPTEAYEHDMKLWWPHNEIMIASLMAYEHTKDVAYADWFEKTLAYCKKYFADPEFGEWYGYLRRDGKPTEPTTKGSTFKGPFHLPRMLIMVDQMLDNLIKES